jgi:hypothetical protein
MLDQLRVALPAPAKISINRAASIISALSSRQYRHPAKKKALLEPRAVPTAEVAGTKTPKV